MHAAVLRYFDQVAHHGSIRRAAATLNVASSAINRQILRLERELGAELFARRRDGVVLTPVGEAMLRHVRDTLADFKRARGEIEGLRGIVSGEVRIAALDSLLVQFVPDTLADLARRYPHLTFSVTAQGPADLAEELRSGRADIAISFVDQRYRDIEVVAALKTPLGAVVAPSHPLARRRRVPVRDCADYPAILVHDRMPLTPTLEAEFARHRTVFRARFTSNSLEFMRAMLLGGLGVGFFTRLGFMREIAQGQLAHVPLAESGLRNVAIGVLVMRARPLSPAVELTLDAVRRNLAALGRGAKAA